MAKKATPQPDEGQEHLASDDKTQSSETAGSFPPNHNAPAALSEDERADLLIVHLQHARSHNDALAEAMEVVKAVKKKRAQHRHEIKADGFPLHLVDEILEDEGRPRFEVEREEELRRSMRAAANQPVGGQLELFNDSFSQTDKDREHWTGAGYTAGLRGADNDPPDECHPEFHNDFRKGWEDGQAKLISAMSTVETINERRI